jgi:hypothetical protein
MTIKYNGCHLCRVGALGRKIGFESVPKRVILHIFGMSSLPRAYDVSTFEGLSSLRV